MDPRNELDDIRDDPEGREYRRRNAPLIRLDTVTGTRGAQAARWEYWLGWIAWIGLFACMALGVVFNKSGSE